MVCCASHGRVFFHVSFGDVPANSDFPMPPPPSVGLLADPDCTAEVIGKPAATFCDLSSSSLLPGTGASRVRTTNLILGILLMRASMASLFFRSTCAYSCHAKIWSGRASDVICSGVMEALFEIIWRAPKREQAFAMPASPVGWASLAIAAGET